MANELEIIQESTLGTIYEPATLEMRKFEEMKQLVQGFADKYSGLAFTRADKKGAEEVRSKLLEVRKKFEEERKIIKPVYNEPLIAYESKIKELNSLIDVPLNQIRDGLKEIEEAEREERVEALNKFLEIKLEGIGVEIEAPATWLNKTMWTSKLNPSAKLSEEIEKAIDAAVKEKEYREMQVNMLTEFCNVHGIEVAGWVSQLDHRNASEIVELIKAEETRKAWLAAEQERKEVEHAAFLLKRQEDLAAIEEVKMAEVPPVEEFILPEVEPIVTHVLRVSGTPSQMIELNKFIVFNGIRVEAVSLQECPDQHSGDHLEEDQGYVEEDLPWYDEDEYPF